MPSSETRTLMSRSCSAQNLTMRVSIGIARCGVRPVVLMPILRIRGRCRWNISTISGRSLRVVGSPPEMFRFSTAPQNGLAHHRLELRPASCPTCDRRASSCCTSRSCASQTQVQL